MNENCDIHSSEDLDHGLLGYVARVVFQPEDGDNMFLQDGGNYLEGFLYSFLASSWILDL
jgi:hypothetical protein